MTGKLILNSICLTFNYENCGTKKFKKWELQSVKEVIKKPYRKSLQAIEIYFHNGKSAFLCFKDSQNINGFFSLLLKILKKNSNLQFDVIEKPEVYFAERKFNEIWEAGNLSNFEYLMLLNKYSGRSFHNLMQYPVFPWVLNNYSDPKINLHDEYSYRQLDCTIAGVSSPKRQAADEVWKYLNKTNAANHYQFKSPYLSGKIVIEYLARIEPYSSLYISNSYPIFDSMKETWESCISNNEENRELIPEFYYFPNFLKCFNMCLFQNPIEQPAWASKIHSFIQTHALALERKNVTLNLDKWIDLIFGEKQQDPKFYNCFCENGGESLEDGFIPVKLFSEKHIQRTAKDLQLKGKNSIILDYSLNKELVKLYQFPNSAITFLANQQKRYIIILNNQKLIRSVEPISNKNQGNELHFSKQDVQLLPHQKQYSNSIKSLICDTERCYAFLDDQNLLVTCRHFDCSCKITNCTTGKIESHLFFHNVIN